MTKTHKVIIKLPPRPPAFMVSTCSSHWREPLLENSNRPQTTMMKNNVLRQLQAHIAEMEHRHEEELRKLKVDHDQLGAHVRRHQGDEHSAHTINECTQGESHPCQTNNTLDDHNISHVHRHEGLTTR